MLSPTGEIDFGDLLGSGQHRRVSQNIGTGERTERARNAGSASLGGGADPSLRRASEEIRSSPIPFGSSGQRSCIISVWTKPAHVTCPCC